MNFVILVYVHRWYIRIYWLLFLLNYYIGGISLRSIPLMGSLNGYYKNNIRYFKSLLVTIIYYINKNWTVTSKNILDAIIYYIDIYTRNIYWGAIQMYISLRWAQVHNLRPSITILYFTITRINMTIILTYLDNIVLSFSLFGAKFYLLILYLVIMELTWGIANNTATSHMIMMSFTALESFDMLCAMNGWQIATYRSAVNAVMVSTVALADISANNPRSWQNISPNTYGYL